VRRLYTAKSEVGNQLNIFVFESGSWIIVVALLIVPSGLTKSYLVAASLILVDLRTIKNARAYPSTIKNKSTTNGKTFFATPIIMAK
jgi:hypothetical protein